MRRTKYPIHPDFKFWTHLNPPLGRGMLRIEQAVLKPLFSLQRSDRTVRVEKFTIPAQQGHSIRALLYTPAGIGENAPVLVLYHGGGFVFPAAPSHYKLAREYALRTPCKVLFAEYRLAPKHPFPAAPEDSFAAYAWLLDHAKVLGVDAERIAVGGDSAGGELATVVCLMARDRGLPVPCAQMLIFPVVGRNMDTPSMRLYTDTPMCNSRDIARYDALYMRDPHAEKMEYGSPYHAPSLAGMPLAYVETAQFDCLRDGGILYAERLRDAGAQVQINNTVGTMHGFDVVLRSPIVRACVAERVRFLQSAFTNS